MSTTLRLYEDTNGGVEPVAAGGPTYSPGSSRRVRGWSLGPGFGVHAQFGPKTLVFLKELRDHWEIESGFRASQAT